MVGQWNRTVVDFDDNDDPFDRDARREEDDLNRSRERVRRLIRLRHFVSSYVHPHPSPDMIQGGYWDIPTGPSHRDSLPPVKSEALPLLLMRGHLGFGWTHEDRMVEQIMMGRAPLPQHGSPWGDNSYGSSSISPIRAHIPEFATPPHHIDGGGGQGCPAHRAHTPEYGSPPTPIRLSPSPIAMSGGCPPTKCLKTPEDLFNGSMSDNSAGPDQGLLTHPYHRSPPTVRSHTSMTRRPGAASPEEDARHAISRAAVLYETTPKGRRFALEADSLTTMVVTAFDVAQAASTGRAGAASVPLGNFPPSLAVGGPRRRTSMVMKPPDSREMEDGQLMSRAVGDKMGSWRERLSHVEDVLKGQGGVLHAAKMAVAHLSEELAPRYEKMFRDGIRRNRRRGVPPPAAAAYLKEGKGIAAWNAQGV